MLTSFCVSLRGTCAHPRCSHSVGVLESLYPLFLVLLAWFQDFSISCVCIVVCSSVWCCAGPEPQLCCLSPTSPKSAKTHVGRKETMMVLTASGSRKAKAVPLIMGDTVEKADIEICKHPSGRGDWLLGTGASGKACALFLPPCDMCPPLVAFLNEWVHWMSTPNSSDMVVVPRDLCCCIHASLGVSQFCFNPLPDVP